MSQWFHVGASVPVGAPHRASGRQRNPCDLPTTQLELFKSFPDYFSPQPTSGPGRQFSPHRPKAGEPRLPPASGRGSPGFPPAPGVSPCGGAGAAGARARHHRPPRSPGRPPVALSVQRPREAAPARQGPRAATAAAPPGLTCELGLARQPSCRGAGPAALHTGSLPPLRHAAASAPAARAGRARPAARPPPPAPQPAPGVPLHSAPPPAAVPGDPPATAAARWDEPAFLPRV